MEKTVKSGYEEIQRHLARVRRRWRRLGVVKGMAIGFVEAAGFLMVFMLADHAYGFSPLTRLIILAAGAIPVGVLTLRHIVATLRREISDAEVALFVEQRHPNLEGALLSAAEFGKQRGSALYNYVIDVLVKEAGRRIELVDVRATVDLGRLKKYAVACVAVVVLFVVTGALFPQHLRRQSARVFLPWQVDPTSDQPLVMTRGGQDGFLATDMKSPLRFRVTPQGAEVLEGAKVTVIVELSRDPLGHDVELLFRSVSGEELGEWQKVNMLPIERVYGFAAPLRDLTSDLEYMVAVGADRSETYRIRIRERLRVDGFEVTYTYPEYLGWKPKKLSTQTGDISVVKGASVNLNIRTNQPLAEGHLAFDEGGRLDLMPAQDGGSVRIPIDRDRSYRYVVRNRHGEEAVSDSNYFIRALPDLAPQIEVIGPNVDLTVHPISEVTFTVKATEDLALKDLRVHYDVVRLAGKTQSRKSHVKSFRPKAWSGPVDGEAASTVLCLEDLKPALRMGDSIFYHFECEDRKGQKGVSDLFYVSVADAAAYVFYPDETVDTQLAMPDKLVAPLLKFIAAAWHLESQRKKIEADAFTEKSKEIAESMIDGETGEVINFLTVGDGISSATSAAEEDPLVELAYKHTVAGHGLLEKSEPGKAVPELKMAWALFMRFANDGAASNTQMMVGAHPGGMKADQSQNFVRVLVDLSNADLSLQPVMEGDIEAPPLFDVEYKRKLGRKDVEKIADTRKKINKLQKDLEEIAEEAEQKKSQPRNEESSPSKPKKTGDTVMPQKKEDKANYQPGEKKKSDGEPAAQSQQQKKEKQENKKGGPSRSGEERKAQQKASKSGEPSKDGKQKNKRPDELQKKTREAAENARKLAQSVQKELGEKENKDVKDGASNLREAAEALKQAIRDFETGKLTAGIKRTQQATRSLKEADRALAKASTGTLDEMLARAMTVGYRIADRQKKISEAGKRLEKDAKEAKESGKGAKKKASHKDLELKEKRKGLSNAQKKLSEQADAYGELLKKLADASEKDGKDRAGKFFKDALTSLKRDDVAQKMIDAAVDLRTGDLKEAGRTQEKVADSMRKSLDALQRASGALSGNSESAMKHAEDLAREVKKASLEMSGLKEKDLKKGQAKDGKKAGKKDGEEAGENQRKGNKPDAEGDGKKKDDHKIVAHSDRKRGMTKLWGKTRRLVDELRRMEYVPEDTVDALDQLSRSESDFQALFERLKNDRLVSFLGLVGSVSEKLRVDLTKLNAAKRLQIGMREGCPPQYRRAVSQYYERLSRDGAREASMEKRQTKSDGKPKAM